MKNTLLAPPVTSNIDKKSEEFAKYKSAMLEKLDGIEDLLDFVELGGGMHHHERLAARGKMSVRDRIANFIDPDTLFRNKLSGSLCIRLSSWWRCCGWNRNRCWH